MRRTNPPQPAATTRVPPQDIEAEKSLLGGLLLSGSSAHLADALGLLTGDMFYRPMHGAIFESMRLLYGKDQPIDCVTVKGAMVETEQVDGQDIGSYLLDLAEFVPSASATAHYAGIVVEKWRLRQVIEKASEAAAQAWSEEGSEGVISAAQQALSSLLSIGQRGEWRDVKGLVHEYLERLGDRYDGGGNEATLPTGFVDIDSLIGGFKRQELTIIAARPSMGKTSLAMEMAMRQAAMGATVAIFSLEMSADSLVNRVISSMASIPSTLLDTGQIDDQQWQRVNVAAGRVYNMNLKIEDETDLTAAQIDAKLRELTLKGAVDSVYIDYLGLIRADTTLGSNTSDVVGDIAKQLKIMARRYDLPMQCLAQLSRAVERREDKRPILSDLRDSGKVEEHADKVIGIYRPSYYARKSEISDEEIPGTEVEEVEVILLKNRNGATGMVRLEFTPAYTRFANASSGGY